MIQTLITRIPRVCLLAILCLPALSSTRADPAAEMASFSLFKPSDFTRLEKGEVLSAHGSPMEIDRGLTAQFAYIVPCDVRKTLDLHKNFSASGHPDLKVFVVSTISPKPLPENFAKMKSPPNNEPIRALARCTLKHYGLQVSADEGKQLARFVGPDGPDPFPTEVSAFWSDLLRRRASQFAVSGIAGQPPYSDSVRASDEAATLLKEQPKIQARFAPLAAQLLSGGDSPALSWEIFDAEGTAGLALGASYSRRNGEGWQTLDADYYSSAGYYVYLTFTEFWPVKVGGQSATLVWRADLVSSFTVGTLHGIEKTIAGNVLIKDVRRNIAAILKDAAR